jgi:hypothetical protein
MSQSSKVGFLKVRGGNVNDIVPPPPCSSYGVISMSIRSGVSITKNRAPIVRKQTNIQDTNNLKLKTHQAIF